MTLKRCLMKRWLRKYVNALYFAGISCDFHGVCSSYLFASVKLMHISYNACYIIIVHLTYCKFRICTNTCRTHSRFKCIFSAGVLHLSPIWNNTGCWNIFPWKTKTCLSLDDVIKWKYFPCYWSFVRGIHRSPGYFPYKGQWRWVDFFDHVLRLNKRLSKHSRRGWFETPSLSLWRHCNEWR